jgi:hypothetical protein
MKRREFLQASAAGAYAVFGTPRPAAEVEEPWFDRPMRWAQLVLVENDPGRFDPDFWLDGFKRVHADGACLSAGGAVAYYPTKVPLHHRSAWLGDSDPFGYLVAAAAGWAWRQKDSMTVHLVNLTNPMMMKGPFRELIPVDAQKVRIRIPQGVKVKKVHLLVSDMTPKHQSRQGIVSLTVPSILDHEVIALDLSG